METNSACILCRSERIRAACVQNAFSRCDDCGHVFDNPRPTTAAIIRRYSEPAQYDAWLATSVARRALYQRRLKKILRLKKGGRLLDVGAGIGEFLSLARAHFEVEGTEVSESAIALAREKFGLSLRAGEFERLTWEEGRYSVITILHVLEHVPFPSKTLELCARLLEPGGILVVAVPNDVDGWLSLRNRMMRKLGFASYQALGEIGLPRLSLEHAEIHLSHFTPASLRAAVVREGLEVVEEGQDPYFAAVGTRRVRRYLRYFRYDALRRLTGRNLYDAMWIAARKKVSVTF